MELEAICLFDSKPVVRDRSTSGRFGGVPAHALPVLELLTSSKRNRKVTRISNLISFIGGNSCTHLVVSARSSCLELARLLRAERSVLSKVRNSGLPFFSKTLFLTHEKT